MGGDDQLGPRHDQLVQAREEGQLPAGRQGRLGFVQYVKAVADKTIVEKGEEGLAVRLFVQPAGAIPGPHDLGTFQIGGDGEEALGAEKEAVLNPLRRPDRPYEPVQRRMAVACAETVFATAAFGVEPPRHRQGLDQRGLS